MDPKHIESAQETLFNKIYVPAFIETYNTKAASVGFPPLQNPEEVERALALVEYIQTVKQASVKNPIDGAFNKLASITGQAKQTKQASVTNARSNDYASFAANDADIRNALKPLLS